MAGYIGNKAVGINVTTGDIRGDVGVGGDVTATTSDGAILNLNSSDTTITDGSVLGAIKFTAPLEGSGTDSVLLGAAIEAVAEATFAADNNATELVFKTGASAAAAQQMTLTSGGNLLVNKASDDNNAGISLRATGEGYFVRSGANVLALNRLSDDGGIISFFKDTSAVGSIGVDSGDQFYFAASDGMGMKVDTDNTSVEPCNAAGADLDNAVNLGAPTPRWKDLYLSGGVHLGGTGAANKLDDYEEGTWTSTFIPSSGFTASSNTATGHYTKIGRQVTVTVIARMTTPSSLGSYSNNATNKSLKVSGLPFTVKNSVHSRSAPAIGVAALITVVDGYLAGHGVENGTAIDIFQNKDNGGTRSSPTIGAGVSNINFHVCFTYFTDA